ncbi:imelysin family protein [Rhabdaerophilum sp. SD176]|uniref:imelysin family protein n=1 Tax=Rhabdaerophilum sp. SD176 TaxID=2983548 RepID=UPI0024E0130C|nr:imelysin family protein [Rhabdaerophilum sp. SD176]
MAFRIRALLLGVAFSLTPVLATASNGPTIAQVSETYAKIARANYEDSLQVARAMQIAVEALLGKPDADTLAKARRAWIDARQPYSQTEAFRFGNPIVDEWEGRVNAWPLDEGLIDYVDQAYGTASESNPFYSANVIGNRKLVLNGETIDAGEITGKLLTETLHQAGKIEANVATGYHAIEFLLWGQDLNGTRPGAGSRPATDFATGEACTNGNCERRRDYLRVVTDLLVEDLEWMVAQWAPGGAATKPLLQSGPEALGVMFTGIGSLSYGELAGERMRLGLLLGDPEEEHDCFSDNTHNSHYYNALGIQNVYLGRYRRIDGQVIEGPGLSDLVKAHSPEIDQRVRGALAGTMTAMTALKTRAETVEAYDQMLDDGNKAGRAVIEAGIQALIGQTREFERAIAALDVNAARIEGSDSLDDPSRALSKK